MADLHEYLKKCLNQYQEEQLLQDLLSAYQLLDAIDNIRLRASAVNQYSLTLEDLNDLAKEANKEHHLDGLSSMYMQICTDNIAEQAARAKVSDRTWGASTTNADQMRATGQLFKDVKIELESFNARNYGHYIQNYPKLLSYYLSGELERLLMGFFEKIDHRSDLNEDDRKAYIKDMLATMIDADENVTLQEYYGAHAEKSLRGQLKTDSNPTFKDTDQLVNFFASYLFLEKEN